MRNAHHKRTDDKGIPKKREKPTNFPYACLSRKSLLLPQLLLLGFILDSVRLVNTIEQLEQEYRFPALWNIPSQIRFLVQEKET